MTALLALITFLAAAGSDVVEAYHVRAVTDYREHRAAWLSVLMYLVGCIGWVVTVKVSLWFCVPEVLGLYAGSWWAVRTQRRAAQAKPKPALPRARVRRDRVVRARARQRDRALRSS